MSLMNYEPVAGFGEKGKKTERLVVTVVIAIVIATIGSIALAFYRGNVADNEEQVEKEQAFKAKVGHPEEDVKNFENKVNQYLFPENINWDFTEYSAVPKFLPVDKSNNSIDEMYLSMPSKIRASNPQEVKTIIWIKCSKREVGTYSGRKSGGTAYKYNCRCYFWDNQSHTPQGVKDFEGGDPPEKIYGFMDGTGSKPYDKIISFLEGKYMPNS